MIGYSCQPYAPAAFTPPPPRKYSWYLFLIQAESTNQGHRKDYFNEKFHDTMRNRTHDRAACSAVP